ncbi:MAG: hypothetical protein AABW58_00525 [Nanoarchaeota archaeon]
MNKKGVELTLETILGLVLGALVVLGLFVGTSKIINTLSPSERIDSFSDFKQKLDFISIDDSERTSSLKLNYGDIVFGFSKSKSIALTRPINYKNPLTNQENILSSIERPPICQDFACVCKCKISDSFFQSDILKCRQENLDCEVIKDIEIVEGLLLANYVRSDGDNKLPFETKDKQFLLLSISELTDQKKTEQDSYVVNLNIKKEGKTLIIS